MPFFYGFDMTYLILIVPCLILSVWASSSVKSTFKQYAQQLSSRGITGAQAAAAVLKNYGVTDVRIEPIAGKLTDHYDPRTNIIRLSEEVYSSTSTAAIGVACHEAGHAIQYAQRYLPLQIRSLIIPVTNFGSKLAIPLILLGTVLSYFGDFSYIIINIGILCFAFSTVLQLITLPVEFNASRRALQAIDETHILTAGERKGAKKTLTAAAMTYVAALAVSLAQLLRLILLFGRRRSND